MRPPEGLDSNDPVRWWDQGAADEAAARNEGLSASVIEARECLESLARLRPEEDGATVVARLWGIYRPKPNPIWGYREFWIIWSAAAALLAAGWIWPAVQDVVSRFAFLAPLLLLMAFVLDRRQRKAASGSGQE